MALERLVIGTRGSALARWQTDHVRDRLFEAWPGLNVEIAIFTTSGDRLLDTPLPLLGGKGAFTEELEIAIQAGRIDLAVHSLKDLPVEDAPGLMIGAILARGNPADALVSRDGRALDALPAGAVIGTCSPRRAAQIHGLRSDVRLTDVRGNVDTRLRKAFDQDGPYDAIVLACAGLDRLGRQDAVAQEFTLDQVLPAPGQAALAVQCRREENWLKLLAPLDHLPTRLAVSAERAFLAGLGGGCALPVAAYGTWAEGTLDLRGRVCANSGAAHLDETGRFDDVQHATSASAAGAALARRALERGAGSMLEAAL